MARIDLLTAQMCRRNARRLCVQSDEKMLFFGAGGEPVGEGATLSGPMIHELLLPIAPVPFDGVPVSFPYKGRDGEFKILVAARCRGFEIHALSFASTSPPTQETSSQQPTTQGAKTAFECGWSGSGKGYGLPAQPTGAMNSLRLDVYRHLQNRPGEASEDDTD